MARTAAQNKRYYQNRVAKAKNEGYVGYGQKRYRLEKAKKEEVFLGGQLDELKKKFPGLEIWDELPPDRERAYNRLVETC
jgi:hypothetical protein